MQGLELYPIFIEISQILWTFLITYYRIDLCERVFLYIQIILINWKVCDQN